MHNKLVHIKCYKIITFLLFITLISLSNANKSESNSLVSNQNTVANENYDFVKFDILFGRILETTPSKILLGLKVNLLPEWKIYWRNPGDAGLPPEIKWEKGNNIKSMSLLFPNPKRFNFFGIETLGYEKEVIFPIEIERINENKEISGSLKLEAQVCAEICVPVNFSYDLSKLNYNYKNNSKLLDILKYKNTVPKYIGRKDLELFSINRSNNKLKLTFKNKLNISPYDIIVEDNKEFIFEKPTYSKTDQFLNVTVNFNDKKNYDFEFLKLTFLSNDHSYEKIITKSLNLFKENSLILNQNKNIISFKILIIALFGGFILNFMPCVLPVLSLKMIQLVNLRTENKVKFKKKIFFNVLGILTSFLILALGTYILKSAGELVGWGIQFQNPYFLIFLILLISFFGLNLLGLFNYFLPSKLLEILSFKGEGYVGDFITGITLTLLATPCTAPLVGTAVGFALSGETFEIFSTLLIMGLGLSLPLILIMLFPKFISIIPKPGKWLLIFKKIMAIMLLLTSIWLINLLIKLETKIDPSLNNYNDLEIVNWDINKNILLPNQLSAKGEIVFVDITADWCLTCQVNKALVLDTRKVSEIFRKNNVKVLVLDWTKPNEYIKKFLNKKGRYGIPYNEIYGPLLPNGKILSELLNIREIQEYIKKAK